MGAQILDRMVREKEFRENQNKSRAGEQIAGYSRPDYRFKENKLAIKAIVSGYLNAETRNGLNVKNCFLGLIECLYDKDFETRVLASYGIMYMCDNPEVKPLHAQAVDPLIQTAIFDDRESTRNYALRSLIVIGFDKLPVDPFMHILQNDQTDQNRYLAAFIAWQLTRSDPDNARKAVQSLTEHAKIEKSPGVNDQIEKALYDIKRNFPDLVAG
jgi:hypothetical protein